MEYFIDIYAGFFITMFGTWLGVLVVLMYFRKVIS